MDSQPSWSPSAASGINIEYVQANGLTFEVAQAGEGDRLALLLHGFPELHYSWRHQIESLVDQGYRVWAPNMRGYGGSAKPRGWREYRLDILIEDVGALIDASGASEVVLVGHDWGAIVAWHFAIRRLRPLARLVIMNVPHPLCARRAGRHWWQLKKSWYILFFQIPWLPEWLLQRAKASAIGRVFRDNAVNKERFADSDLTIYRAAAMRPGALTAMINYYRAMLRMPDYGEVGDGRVDIPTLVVWGEQDFAIDIRCLDGLEQYVSNLTLRRFEEASHWVQQDIPQAVNEALKGWLAG